MKLLIAGPHHFAAIVCSTLLVRCLKKQLPEAQIYYAVKEQLSDVLCANPYIDALITEESAAHQTQGIDCIIDLTDLQEWKGVAAKKDYTYLSPKLSLLQRLGIHFQKTHLAIQYLAVAKPLLINDDGLGMDYFIPAGAQVAAYDIPAAHSAGYIALVLDAHWLNNSFMHLLQVFCKALQHPVILIGEKNTSAAAAQLSAVDEIKIYAACGKFTRSETADLIRSAKMLITPEAGWMQVAATFKKPVIALGAAINAAYYPPLYAQSFLKAKERQPYAVLRTGSGPKKAEALAGQLLQAVQQFLAK